MSTFLCVKNGNQTVTFCPTSETQGNFIRVGNDRFKLRSNHITGRSPYIHVKKDGVTYEIDAKRRTTTELMSEEISGEKFPLDVANSGMSFSTVSGVTNTAENSYVQTVRRTATRFYPGLCAVINPAVAVMTEAARTGIASIHKFVKSNSTNEKEWITYSFSREEGARTSTYYSYTVPAITEMENLEVEAFTIIQNQYLSRTAQMGSSVLGTGSIVDIRKTSISQSPWSIDYILANATSANDSGDYIRNLTAAFITDMWKSTEPDTATKKIYMFIDGNPNNSTIAFKPASFGYMGDYGVRTVSESTNTVKFSTYSTTDEFTKSVFQSTAYTEVDA